MIVNVSCLNIFMVRLEIVRFKNNFFNVVGIDEVFYRVWIERIFLRIVRKENNKFII